VECVAAGLGLRATGSGASRRSAEQQAAGNLLKLLET
jgi:dsRNA-specific ribonuclease